MKTSTNLFLTTIIFSFFLGTSFITQGQEWEDKPYLKDRGSGLPTSMFGTYIEKGDVIVYPFYEYYNDQDFEYKPAELGALQDVDYRGEYIAHEGLIYLAYGISDWIGVEIEAALISATLDTSPLDTSGLPETIKESGLGDVEGQIRWRYNRETEKRPEYFSYFEVVLPLTKDKPLTGTGDWEFKLGSGLIKGFKFGTFTFRAAMEYDGAENKFEVGEIALEYLKRVNKWFRFYVGVEGTDDEWEGITDLQFHVNSWMFFRLNNAFGITSKATDYAPEVGVVMYLNKI